MSWCAELPPGGHPLRFRGARVPRICQHALVLAVAILGALTLACQRGAGPVHVVSVAVAEGAVAEPLREAGLDAAALEEAARVALVRAGFRLGDGGRPYRARVDVLAVRFAPDPFAPGSARAELSVELTLTPAAPGEATSAREASTAAAPIAGRAPSDAWRTALAAGANEAARALALGFAAADKKTAQLIADLGSPDARQRDQAVRALAERGAREAVPALLERLRDPDPDVMHRAIGALAELHDPRAVGPLIDAAQRGDAAFTARVARVLGDLGGPEAEGYLLTLASGHEDPAVRRAAREAAEALRARANTPAVAAGR
jgi:hypothetical protein